MKFAAPPNDKMMQKPVAARLLNPNIIAIHSALFAFFFFDHLPPPAFSHSPFGCPVPPVPLLHKIGHPARNHFTIYRTFIRSELAILCAGRMEQFVTALQKLDTTTT